MDASCLSGGHPGAGALPAPTARPFGRAAGAHCPLAVGAEDVGVGTAHQPTARAPASWLCVRWGRHEGARGGAPLAWMWGVRGRALPHPRPLVLGGVLPGPTTQWLWVRRMRAWGPVTNSTTRTLASWLCALWGRQEGARRGAPLASAWGVQGQALSHPRPLLCSMRPGLTTHWLLVRGPWAWGPVTNCTARALAS